MDRCRSSGFTLAELMVAIVIIGILAAISLPSYIDNVNRSKIVESINYAVVPTKNEIAEYYSAYGWLPPDRSYVGIVYPGTDRVAGIMLDTTYNLLTSAMPQKAEVRVAYKNFAVAVPAGATLVYHVDVTASGGLIWHCQQSATGSTLVRKYLPAICQG